MIDAVRNHLVSVLSEAKQRVLESSPNTKAIGKVFRDKKVLQLSLSELERQGLMLDYPNKVFREVTRLYDIFIEPSTSAVGLILGGNFILNKTWLV
ncbi:hypothetical protein EON65_44330 [archaeon]|nr:MAG: hypothetical protein EON65_44330 [archaeon]